MHTSVRIQTIPACDSFPVSPSSAFPDHGEMGDVFGGYDMEAAEVLDGFSCHCRKEVSGWKAYNVFHGGDVYPCILDRSSYVVCRYGIVVDKSTTIRSATIWNNGKDVKNRHEWGCPDLNRGQ